MDTDKYVLHVCRYIHLNPVRGGLVTHPGDWPYSNCLEWVQRRSGLLVDATFVQQYFPESTGYERFVLSEVDVSMEEQLEGLYLDRDE